MVSTEDMEVSSTMTKFSQNKFISLPPAQQHKKLAEILRQVYGELLSQNTPKALLDHYCELCLWIDFPLLQSQIPSAIADRYHQHLRLANQQLKEHNLLPQITTTDRSEAAPVLPITIYLDHIRSAHNIGSIL